MARQKGSATFAGTIEVNAGGPLDARSVVPSKSDLTVASNFPYPYEGMVVYCKDNDELYKLTADDVTVATNWVKVGSGGGGDSDSSAYQIKYSTDEQIVGEWIDGKPIYQKTLTGLSNYSVSSSSWSSLPSSPSDIYRIINIILYQDDGYSIFTVRGAQYFNNTIKVMVSGSSSISNITGYTVQYTKTID